MIKSNCHTHTLFCDGKNTAQEMAERAVALGFDSLGFSVHSPMNFENDYAIKPDKLPEYCAEIHRLKEEYRGKIEIYCGIELDADFELKNDFSFDYVIASVHQIKTGGKIYYIDNTPQELSQCVEKEFASSWEKMAKYYFDRLASFVEQTDADIVGHFDLIEKFNENKLFFDSEGEEYICAAKSCIDRILKSKPNIIFEVNTGAMFRKGKAKPYPMPSIMQYLKEKNARITVTSDAHCVKALDFAFDKAEDYCRKFGFEEIYVLKNGSFSKVSLL